MKKMKDILKIVDFLEDSDLLIKDITQTIENKNKEQRCIFLNLLLVTLDASLLGNMLSNKGVVVTRQDIAGVIRASTGVVIRAGNRVLRARQCFFTASSFN